MIALDNMPKKQVFDFLEQTPNELELVKIGLELFLSEGRSLVKEIHQRFEKRIFLDLKLHDIPNTVSKALNGISDLPVEFITVHLSGGRQMLEACQTIRNTKMSHVNILGVSYLTSLDEENFNETFNYPTQEIPSAFDRLFNLAIESGTQGVVCSPKELNLVAKAKSKYGKQLLSVCPGIRFQDEIDSGNIGDQKRVLSPKKAFSLGADYLVMGRSLTQATNISERISELNLAEI
jgi:orotidine-5'-phosphate decarboxylase